MSPSYVNQNILFQVEVARETGVLADSIPTLTIEDKDGTVLATYDGDSAPAVVSLGDGSYTLETSFPTEGEYYFTWSWELGAVPLTEEGSVTVCLPSSRAATQRRVAGYAELSGQLRRFDGSPVPFTAVLFSVDASDRRPYIDRTALLQNDTRAISDRNGDFSILLPRGATFQVRFPHIDQQYSFTVPDTLKGDLFDYLFPHPVSLRWVEWDPVGEEYTPVVLNVDGDGVRVAVEAVWSNGTCTALPPDLSASATLGAITEELLADSVEYELTNPAEAEVEHVPDDELWELAGYDGDASFMPFNHELYYLAPLTLVRP